MGASRELTSRIMASVRTRGTAPEIALGSALRRAHLRPVAQYRTNQGRADFAFPAKRVAVFVDGDFWHGHSWRRRGFASLEAQFARWRNGAWWLEKIRTNMRRDERQSRALRRAGWHVLRLRESDIETNIDRCVVRTLRAVDG